MRRFSGIILAVALLIASIAAGLADRRRRPACRRRTA